MKLFAPAKINLSLHVAEPRPDGMHPLCSLFARLALCDELTVTAGGGRADRVSCPGIVGPNLAARAVEAFRAAAPAARLQPLEVEIDKRIPVAAGLGGGSADAAAVLRACNELAGEPLDRAAMMELAAGLGADVPSQIAPGHALVQGIGELVEPVALPSAAIVLVPAPVGLSTAAVYAELDRLRASGELAARGRLDPAPLRAAAASGDPEELVGSLANDLEPAALSLEPSIGDALAEVRRAGALAARVTGSGPTVFGVFADPDAAAVAARELPGSIVTALA